VEREAAVRLTLDNAQYLVGIRRTGDATADAVRKAESESRRWTAGLNAAKDSVRELGGSLRQVAGFAAGLGGAFSLGSAMQQAIALEGSYKNLAFAVQAGTGALVDHNQLQREGAEIAGEWRRANDEVAQTLTKLNDDLGDLEFAKAATEEIAKAATATGKSMAVLTPIVGALNEKFDITGERAPEAIAQLISASAKGGVTIEDLGAKIDAIGASAKLAGLEGEAGFGKVVAMLNIADNVAKKPLMAVGKLLDAFANADKLKTIQKELGVELTTKDGTVRDDAIQRVLAKTRGKKETLSKVFAGDELKLMVEFGKVFEKGFAETVGTVKQKTDAGVEAFNKALSDSAKQTITAADLEAQAVKRREDPERQFQAAMNELTDAMAEPQMIEALHELAKVLPDVAHFMAVLLKFVAENPLLAGGGFVGAKVGGAFLQGALLRGGGGGGGLLGGIAGGTANVGRSIASSFGEAVSTHGAWKTAGAALGIAGGAIIAHEIGRALIDAELATAARRSADVVAGDVGAHAAAVGGSREAKEQALKAQRARLAELQEDGPGVISHALGGIANVVSGGEVKSAGEVHQDQIAKTEASIRQLQAELANPGQTVSDIMKFRAAHGPEGAKEAPAPVAKEPPAAVPRKVTIENEESFARVLARALGSQTMKVELKAPLSGLHGPPTPEPPKPGV